MAKADGLDIAWERQPLEGFESHPIEDLAARYDLVVIDHPHIGEAAKADCFRPLDSLFPQAFLAELERGVIGPAYRSYVYGGQALALPLDAATQVQAARLDLLEAPLPASWAEVEALAARRPVCLSIAGPHAILSFLSICVALGEEPAAVDPERLVSHETGIAALSLLRAVYARMTRAAIGLNPIGILDRMVKTNDIALCPLVYGYVNYARKSEAGPSVVTFADAPTLAPGGRPGSTLGGTGIAVSRRCEPSRALVDHLAWLVSRVAQEDFVPEEAGQPCLRSAWASDKVNAAWGNFYRNTARTLESAYVRPRYPGYIAFQAEASAHLREALEAGAGEAATLDRLQALFAGSRRSGDPI